MWLYQVIWPKLSHTNDIIIGMTTLPPYLSKEPLLPTVWEAAGSTGFFVSIHKNGSVHTWFDVTNEQLNQHHPQLANGVRALLQCRAYSLEVGRAQARHVIATFDLLCERYIEFTDDRQTPRVMLDITGINKTGGMYEITGTLVDVEMFEVLGEHYPYAEGLYFTTFATNGVELEYRYPGWEARYEVCQGLSMEWPEMMGYIFTSKPVENATLPTNGMD